MTGSAIRELRSARNVGLVSAAFNKTTVQVWDVTRQQKVCEFAAQYDFGAANLAMHPSGEFIVTGLSAGNGIIAGYTARDGALLWQRNRLSYPSYLRFSPSGNHVSCTVQSRGVERIDANTGFTSDVIKGASLYIEGVYGHLLTKMELVRAYLLRGDGEFRIGQLTFALLDASFLPDSVCLTESTGPVRCIEYANGEERWRFSPPSGSHVLKLHYSPKDEFVYGVLRHYEKGLFRYLLRFDSQTGQAEKMCDLDSWEEAFLECTNQLVTSTGDIIDLSSGQIVGTLSFPQTQYPDHVPKL